MGSWIQLALALALALALPRVIAPPSATLDPAPSLVATLADEIPTHLVEARAAFSQARGRNRFLPVLFPTSNSCPCSQSMIP